MKRIVALLLSLVMLGMLVGCDSSDYKKAISLYESGDYKAAVGIFVELGDYEDSVGMATKCNYQIAKQNYENKEYTEAIEQFEALAGYEDSADLLMQCRYEYAKILFDDSKYTDARNQFQKLEQTEEVNQYLRLSAWGMLQTYVEENGPIIDKVETFDPAGSEEIVATYNISNRRGALTIQTQMTSNKKQTDGLFYIRVGKSADTEIVFNMETDCVNVNSDYNYEMENNVNSGPSSKKHYVGSAIWNIHDFYADGDVNDFVEVVEGEFNLGFLYNQQIGVVEFLMVQLPKTDLGINIRDLGFVDY